MMRVIGILICTLALGLALQFEAVAQSDVEHEETYAVGSPVMAYADFPFPDIPEGEIWVPDLTWQPATTIAYDLHKQQDAPYLPKTELSLDEYIEQGRLNEVLADFDAFARDSSWGAIEYEIGSAYQNGNGGLEKDLNKAIDWYKRGAMKKPVMYYLIAGIHLSSDDPALKNRQLAAHYYSKGASRGCYRCAQQILYMIDRPDDFPGLIFPHDASLRYYVYLNDLGYPHADMWLYRYLNGNDLPHVIAFNQKVFGYDGTPSMDSGEMAAALKKRFRTGLVPAGCIRAKNEVDAGEMIDAFDTLSSEFGGCFGRFRGQLLGYLITKNANSVGTQVPGTGPNYLGKEALRAGEFDFAVLGAMAYTGIKTAEGYGKNFKIETKEVWMFKVESVLEPAFERGLITREDVDYVVGSALAEEARVCWQEALNNTMGTTKFSRDNIRRISTNAGVNRCYEKESKVISLTGNTELFADWDSLNEYRKQSRVYGAEDSAVRQRAIERAAANRASFRTSPSGPTRSSSSPSSAPMPGVVSSADAYAASKKTVCASSMTKTSFCR